MRYIVFYPDHLVQAVAIGDVTWHVLSNHRLLSVKK